MEAETATTIAGPSALTRASATELAARIRRGDVSAREVVEAHIARIEAVNPRLNAVIVPLFDDARVAADAADAAGVAGRPLGPLHGIPMTVKEQFLVAGTPTTFGLAWRRDHRADRDGPLVAAVRAAGAIILGKTNVSQTLIFHEADNPVYGLTRNPWNLERTPGGSSGGEAAIIAAGGSALGLGGDLGGSVRVPAHFCGIAGLKPTSLRLTLADTPADIMAAPEQLPFQPGPLARHVTDLHLAMSVLAPASVGAADTTVAPAYPAELPEVRGLRVAVHLDDPSFQASPAIRRAVSEAAAHLVRAGAVIVDFVPPSLADASRLFLAVMAADGGRWIRAALHGERPDRRVAGLLQAGTIPNWIRPLISLALRYRGQASLADTIVAARTSPGAALRRIESELAAYRATHERAMAASGVDVVLSPPHALPALRHGATEHLHVANAAAWSVLYNVLGFPAGVVPVTLVRPGEESDRRPSRDRAVLAALDSERGSAGLPVGVQVAARPWREDLVLAAMRDIETATRTNGQRESVGMPEL